MDVEVNYIAVLLAVLASFAIGAIWYSPKVLGKRWAILTHQKGQKSKKVLWSQLLITAMCLLVLAYALAYATYISHMLYRSSFLQDALSTAFWLWLGIAVTTLIAHDVFERRPMALTVMTVGYQFVLMMTMGLIIGLVEPSAITAAKNAVS